MILEGISKRMYGTKKMVNAILYCVEPGAIFRSSRRPKMMAFAMFVLSVILLSAMISPRNPFSVAGSYRSRKANKYKILRHGIKRKSIFVMRRLSVV